MSFWNPWTKILSTQYYLTLGQTLVWILINIFYDYKQGTDSYLIFIICLPVKIISKLGSNGREMKN